MFAVEKLFLVISLIDFAAGIVLLVLSIYILVFSMLILNL